MGLAVTRIEHGINFGQQRHFLNLELDSSPTPSAVIRMRGRSLSWGPAKMKHLVFASLAFLTLIAVTAAITAADGAAARVLSDQKSGFDPMAPNTMPGAS